MPSAQIKKPQPTVEEIIAVLKKTTLPTVVCEGSDDLIVYRRLEERLSQHGVSVLPAGGRLNVLQIFERRAEIPSFVRLAFIADRDTWVNTSVPAQYVAPVLCLTSGYSIENDVIADGNLEALLAGPEKAAYQLELTQFLDWYALALNRHLANPSEPIAHHPDYVLNPAQRPALLALRAGESYPSLLRASIFSSYIQQIRGKSLLSLLIRNTNTRSGQPRHTDKALLEMVAVRPGVHLTRISREIEAVLALP